MIIKTATVSKNRQIAIPADFNIKPGEKVILEFNPKTGKITLKHSSDVLSEIRGALKGIRYSSDQFIKDRKEEDKKRDRKLGIV